MLLSRLVGPAAVVLGAVSLGGCHGYATYNAPRDYSREPNQAPPATRVQ